MIHSVVTLEAEVRKYVNENFPDLPLAFNFEDPVDASQNGRGDLFKQEENFAIVLLDYEDEKALLSAYGSAAVNGAVEFYVASKSRSNDLEMKAQLEQLCRLFTHKALLGVKFRGINPGNTVSYRGFTLYPGEVPFLAKLRPQEV